MRALKPYPGAEFLLVSGRGRAISATGSPALRTRRIEDTPFGALLKPFYQGAETPSLILANDPVSGEAHYFADTRIPTGKWSPWVSVGRDEPLKPVWAEVRVGVEETMRLGEQLGVIIESVEKLKPRYESARQGMRAQTAGAGQINESMMQLRDVAAASDDSADALAATANELRAAFEALKSEVARFKTR